MRVREKKREKEREREREREREWLDYQVRELWPACLWRQWEWPVERVRVAGLPVEKVVACLPVTSGESCCGLLASGDGASGCLACKWEWLVCP